MHELDDIALLREYVERNSEEAFAELVARHVNKVYSVALRHTANPHQAEEITQAVFVILARKSPHFGRRVVLEGWLYQTARLTALTSIRSEIRRVRREQEAHMQSWLNENEPEVWAQIAPLLDRAMAKLNETDRQAVVLRFIYGKSMKEIGTAMGGTEHAAKMRVNRALEKLHAIFTKCGVSSTTAVIAGAISANSVQAAPAVLAKTATAIALAKGATASGSTLALIKGALKVMAWTKAKTAMVVGLSVLLAAGTATIVTTTLERKANPPANEIYEKLWAMTARSSPPAFDTVLSTLKKAPPVLIVRPTHYPNAGYGDGAWGAYDDKGFRIITHASVPFLMEIAYGFPPSRTVLPDRLPEEKYDLMEILPVSDTATALKEEIKKQFGIVAHAETRETNAFLLVVKNPGKLQSHLAKAGNRKLYSMQSDHNAIYFINDKTKIENYSFNNEPLNDVASNFERVLGVPIFDRSGLTNRYDFSFQWDTKLPPEPIKVSVREQLYQFGLELRRSNEPVEMLVVEKVK